MWGGFVVTPGVDGLVDGFGGGGGGLHPYHLFKIVFFSLLHIPLFMDRFFKNHLKVSLPSGLRH